jgi:hypothetical protein
MSLVPVYENVGAFRERPIAHRAFGRRSLGDQIRDRDDTQLG